MLTKVPSCDPPLARSLQPGLSSRSLPWGCGAAQLVHAGHQHRCRESQGSAWLCLTACLSQVNVDPEDLIPKLPKPRDLQPFPTTQALVSGCVEPGRGGGCRARPWQ